ncbi:hypothetical protein [Catellatospora chokoriensis]|nr:hypothetical protein [Catellatospora chokoriensis]
MRRMSALHARHAWDQRYRDPIAPHSLAVLYVQPDSEREQRYLLSAAWRLWLEGPEATDLPRLLFDLHHQLAPRAVLDGFDIRDELMTGRDKTMSAKAVYAGVAVSSLDTEKGTWVQARRAAASEGDIPGRVFVVLTDGTVVLCDRGASTELGMFKVRSTHDLDYAPGHSPYSWTAVTRAALSKDPDDPRDPLRWLAALSDTFEQADNRRVLSTRAAGGQPGRRRA